VDLSHIHAIFRKLECLPQPTRRADALVKAVALMGFGTPDDIERGKEGCFDFHLTKPGGLSRTPRRAWSDRCVARKVPY
jgi:hypothetical protein